MHQGQFFDKATMKFFNSKIYPSVYGGKYFITSEQDRHGQAFGGKRVFTVREWDVETDRIRTIGTMGDFRYLEDARDFAKTMAKSDMPIGRNPAGGLPLEFRLYTYDVWGNEEDGYNVNDVFQTSEIYKLFKDYTDREILEALQEQGAIPKAGIQLDLVDIEGDFGTSLAFYYNGRPEFELRIEN